MARNDRTPWNAFSVLRSKLTVASLAVTLLSRKRGDAASARYLAHLRTALAAMTREVARLERHTLALPPPATAEDRVIETHVRGVPPEERAMETPLR